MHVFRFSVATNFSRDITGGRLARSGAKAMGGAATDLHFPTKVGKCKSVRKIFKLLAQWPLSAEVEAS